MRLFLLFTFTFLFIVSFAQQKDIVFEQITNESGRSLGFITGIEQDSTGFMWFATRGGLYRYNGYSYKLYKNNPKDSTSLPYNDITSLYIDNNQNLWMRHYDALSVFKNGKRSFDFDSITSYNYDIEVKIIQDGKGYYWIGPTGKGLLMYDHVTGNKVMFHNPLPTYKPSSWSSINSIINTSELIAKIESPPNNCDTTIVITLSEDGYYLFVSSGEVDKYGKYDYGTLLQDDKIITGLSVDKAMYSGGQSKNVFEAEPIYLVAGTYLLNYKSDMSNTCGDWDGKAPDKTDFCGTALIRISEKKYKSISTQEFAECYTDSTYIISNHIKDMLIDKNRELWVLTDKGLEKYNYTDKIFEHYAIDYKSLLGIDIGKDMLRFYQDKQGVFWIGSMYGLIRYEHLLGKFTVFQNRDNKQVLTSNVIYSLFEDNSKRLWIGTDKGINIYDKEHNTITNITANNHNRLYDNRIIDIYEDKGGNVWVATFEGLNRLIKDPFTFTPLGINADNRYPAVYDNKANIWYAIDNSIYKYSRNYQTITSYNLPDKLFNVNEFTGEPEFIIRDMVIDKKGNVWVATDNKVSCFNTITKQVDYIKEQGAVIVNRDSLKNITQQLIYNNGHIFVFYPNGMLVINEGNVRESVFYPFPVKYDYIDEVDMHYFKSAEISKDNELWIKLGDGMYCYNIIAGEMTQVYAFDEEFKNGPLSKGEFDIDSKGNVWVATLPLLIKTVSQTKDTTRWICPFNHDWGVSNIKVKGDNIYLYGTNGLYIFNEDKETFSYASIEDGFVDNGINGVDTDNRGNLWLTTLKGLIKYNPITKEVKNFFTSADFTQRHFLGNPRGFILNSPEKILFTTKGYISFYPDSINNNIPNVVIDKFTIRGKEYGIDSLLVDGVVTLTHKQNFIGFEFASLDYTNPAENRYKFMLEGLDDEWNETDATNRRANYSGISPGHYVFKVKASNNDNVWNDTGASIEIVITPPWYKTTLAYIIYLIVTVVSFWLYIKIREKRLVEEKRMLEQKVRERTAEIEAQKEKLAMQKEVLAEKNKNINDSILYAQKIQQAILPPVEQITEVIEDYFILFRPRDIVSGDFYWTAQRGDISIIVAADCTGHGVPGAFMSMLGIAFLNEIVNKEGVIAPDAILNRLRAQVINQLHQEGEGEKEGKSKDGMDISLYTINHKSMTLQFSGAYNPLYIIRDDELIQLKADRMPIGYYIKDADFTLQEFDLQKGDVLYNFSDGYVDQFGGEDGRKFMAKRFKKLLLDINKKPMNEQKEILNQTIDEWIGKDGEQIDDIVVVGVRV